MTEKGLELIKYFEGCRLTAYKCPAGVWTIGYGATRYADGTKVKEGDKLKSKEEAVELLKVMIKSYENSVDKLVTSKINPFQRDALTSFTYNLGAMNLGKSTLLKKVNRNPDDPTIKEEFAKWVHSGKKVLKGLVNRRNAEIELYYSNWEETLPHYDGTVPMGPFNTSKDPQANITWLHKYEPFKEE